MTDDDTPTAAVSPRGTEEEGQNPVYRLLTIDSSYFDVVFTVVLWGFIGVLILLSLGLKATARHVPLVIAVPTFLLLSVILLTLVSDSVSNFADRIADTEVFGATESELPGTDEEDEEEHSLLDTRKNNVFAIATVFGLFGLVYVVGFYVAIPVFLVVLYRVKAKQNWFVTISTTVLIWVFVVLVFHVLLNVRLYPGILDLRITPYVPF